MTPDELESSAVDQASRSFEQSEVLRRFLDLNEDLMALVDAGGRFTCANRSAARVLGVPAEELGGRSIFEFVHPDDLGRTQEAFQLCCRDPGGRPHSFEHRIASGAALAWRMSARRSPSGRLIDLAALARRATAAPDGNPGIAAREEAMLRALAAIGDSASILLHDLKNPITGIQLAVKAVADRLGEDEREILNDLHERLVRVERSMRRALTFARPQRLRPGPIAPRSLLEKAAERVRQELAERAVDLAVDAPGDLPRLDADASLLEEALVDLLRNALEAVGPRGRIRLSAARAASNGVELCVEDDGPGIPEPQLASLFKPFSTTRPEHAGMGLALAKKIAEAHGGRIRAGRSALGGARLEISLPAAAADGNTSERATA